MSSKGDALFGREGGAAPPSNRVEVFSPVAPTPQKTAARSKPDLNASGDFAHLNSLTPVNVLQYMRETVVLTLGLGDGVNGSFTKLESHMIEVMEGIVRKGQCPSVLFKSPELFEALTCLQKCFDKETAIIELEDEQGGKTRAQVSIFASLCQYAKEASYCGRKTKELRVELNQTHVIKRRQKLKAGLEKLKRRKEKCLMLYQKIVFADAAAQRDAGVARRIRLNGKEATLDELMFACKQQGVASYSSGSFKLDLSLSRTHNTGPAAAGAPRRERNAAGQEEVLDWRRIKPS